ncbi:MAG: hypothetical protein Q8K70_00240 [Bacteroidota bacterium]|nr:hypothetical protein [Bacteroidota bacterium]
MTEFNNLGTDSSFVFFLTSKQAFHKYFILMIDSSDLTLKVKKTISFESKKEEITRAVLNHGKLFLETKMYVRNQGEIINKYVLNPYTLQKLNNDVNYYEDTLTNVYNTILIHNPLHHRENIMDLEGFAGYNYILEKLSSLNGYKINNSVQDDKDIYYYKSYLKNFEILNLVNNKKRDITLKNGMKILKYALLNDKDSNFRLVGIFNNGQEKSYGIFQMFLNFNLEEIKTTTYLTLLDKNSLPENNINSEFLFNSFSFKHYINTINDNHIFIYNKYIYDKRKIREIIYQYQSNLPTTIRDKEVLNVKVGNVLIYNFNKDGDISVNKINLSQSTYSNKKSISYLLKVIDNQIAFVFYDNYKNIIKNDKQVTCDFTNSTVLMTCNYDINLNKVGDKRIIGNSKEIIFFIEFDDLKPIVNGKNVTYFYFGKRTDLAKKCHLYKLQF